MPNRIVVPEDNRLKKKVAIYNEDGIIVNVKVELESYEPDPERREVVTPRGFGPGDKFEDGEVIRGLGFAPVSASKLDIVRALRDMGLWVSFQTSLNRAPSDIKEDWGVVSEIYREDSLMAYFIEDIPLEDRQVVDLFRRASRKGNQRESRANPNNNRASDNASSNAR